MIGNIGWTNGPDKSHQDTRDLTCFFFHQIHKLLAIFISCFLEVRVCKFRSITADHLSEMLLYSAVK